MLNKLSPQRQAAIALAFVLVFIKKWEPGGNIDTIWYSAVSKNAALSGDFFNFTLSKYFVPEVHDHMPLTYWITAGMFRLFGISDFVARIYPMLCSFLSFQLVFAIGRRIRGDHFGLIAVLCYAACWGATKWSSSLMQDVPLTTYFLATTYCLIRAMNSGRWLIAAAPFIVLGVWTKGPIIGAIGLAVFAWVLWENRGSYIFNRWLVPALLTLAGLASVLLHPALSFDGQNAYAVFLNAKKTYFDTETYVWWHKFAYLEVLWTNAAITFLLALSTVPRLFSHASAYAGSEANESGSARSNARDGTNAARGAAGSDLSVRASMRLIFLIAILTVIPLSVFQVKFPHYMLPVYPMLALLAAWNVSDWVRAWREAIAWGVKYLAVIALCVLAALPIKTTGGRNKDVLNLVNTLKLDPRIATKTVMFAGDYDDDMSLFQSFKWWARIDVHSVMVGVAQTSNLKNTYVILPARKLPLFHILFGSLRREDSIIYNDSFAVFALKDEVQFELPEKQFPHEIY